MSDLTQHLLARIEAHGPMTVADFMSEALLHPTLGYYPSLIHIRRCHRAI